MNEKPMNTHSTIVSFSSDSFEPPRVISVFSVVQ